LAHRLAARPDAASTACLVPRSLSLPRREAPPLWETPRAANQSKEGRPSLPLARDLRLRAHRRGRWTAKPSC